MKHKNAKGQIFSTSELTGNCFPQSRENRWLNIQPMDFSERTGQRLPLATGRCGQALEAIVHPLDGGGGAVACGENMRHAG